MRKGASGQIVQDWKPQVFNFGAKSQGGAPRKATEAQAARSFQKGEEVDVVKKQYHQSNAQAHGPGARARKLDESNDDYREKKVAFNVSLEIQRARQANGWTQQDLAREISEKVQVVNEYEGGRAIPVESVLQKMERALKVHLRGVKAGQPIEAKKPKERKQ